MAMDLEARLGIASPTEVGTWVESMAFDALAQRKAVLAEIESSSSRIVDVSELTGSVARSSEPGSWASGIVAGPSRSTLRDRKGPLVDSIPVSVETATPWWRGIPALLLLGALLLGGVVLLLVLRTRPPVAPPVAEVAASVSTAAPPRAVPAAVETASAAPTATAAVTATAAATTVAAASAAAALAVAPTAAHGPAEAPRAQPVRPAAPPKRAAAVECDPPYSLDAQGHKHWKDECFRK
jgi:serine/threonine-protein kinase